MTRFTLKTCTSVSEAVDLITSLTARFIKDLQRKPVSDLLVSTTYEANATVAIPAKTLAPVKTVHEITLMITDKVAKETEAGKLAAEVAWFKGAVV